MRLVRPFLLVSDHLPSSFALSFPLLHPAHSFFSPLNCSTCRYGLLRAPDAPLLLSHALSSSPAPLWSHWRGRLGLSPSAVKDAYASRKGEVRIGRKEEKRRELGESVELVFRTFEGEERRCRGYEGETLMVRSTRPVLSS